MKQLLRQKEDQIEMLNETLKKYSKCMAQLNARSS